MRDGPPAAGQPLLLGAAGLWPWPHHCASLPDARARWPQAAADWGKLAHLPYAAHLLASEPGQAILQKAAGLSPDALRGILAWRVRRRGAAALGPRPGRAAGRRP